MECKVGDGSYTMDHEVIPRPCSTGDWLLNLSQDHFGLHQGTNDKVTMEFEVLKRPILRSTLSTDMVQRVLWWERQKRYVGVIWFMFSNFYALDLHNKSHVALANLQ